MTDTEDRIAIVTPPPMAGFSLLDSGNGRRLERWGTVLLDRPDPQAVWQCQLEPEEWSKATAAYEPGAGGKGQWHVQGPLPEPWQIELLGCQFKLELTPFKHTGLFPEQAAQWDFAIKAAAGKPLRVLNLFGYTGGATVALAKAGCTVTHVDASKPSVTWANENAQLNNIPYEGIRWMLDDALAFVRREVKRGAKYEGVIMDPPAFGHGTKGQVWKFAEHLPLLFSLIRELLSPEAKFVITNGYATNSSALALKHITTGSLGDLGGEITSGELCLREEGPAGRLVSTGIYSRWLA